MREKIVIIGAGSAVFAKGLFMDLIEREWDCELCLVDIDPVALEVAKRLAIKLISERKAPISVLASTDRCEVLRDATVVVCTIGVGGRRAWEKDVFIPRKYGIYQPVGDSVLVGGASRALRMIPAMVDIALDVQRLAPKALFFNYANPMGPICRAVRKATGVNMVGLCHSVHHVSVFLARLLGLPKINYNAVGVNHLTWFLEVCDGEKDLMPQLRGIADEILQQDMTSKDLGIYFLENGKFNKKSESSELFPFSWELLRLFGAFPAALDRHITEFFPQLFASKGSYYGKTLGVDSYNLEQVIAYGDYEYEEMRKDAFLDSPLGDSHFKREELEKEQLLKIIESIRGNLGGVYSANLPNAGRVPNLPSEAIIESPAAADAFGLRGISQKPLPTALAGILMHKLGWAETVVEAALTGSRDTFVQAIVMDGSASSVNMASRLADELLMAQIEYLPQFKRL